MGCGRLGMGTAGLDGKGAMDTTGGAVRCAGMRPITCATARRGCTGGAGRHGSTASLLLSCGSSRHTGKGSVKDPAGAACSAAPACPPARPAAAMNSAASTGASMAVGQDGPAVAECMMPPVKWACFIIDTDCRGYQRA